MSTTAVTEVTKLLAPKAPYLQVYISIICNTSCFPLTRCTFYLLDSTNIMLHAGNWNSYSILYATKALYLAESAATVPVVKSCLHASISNCSWMDIIKNELLLLPYGCWCYRKLSYCRETTRQSLLFWNVIMHKKALNFAQLYHCIYCFWTLTFSPSLPSWLSLTLNRQGYTKC